VSGLQAKVGVRILTTEFTTARQVLYIVVLQIKILYSLVGGNSFCTRSGSFHFDGK